MIIKQYLKSRYLNRIRKYSRCVIRIYDERGNDVAKFIDLGDKDIWESFIKTHEVLKVEILRELDSNNEEYVFIKIFTML